MQTVSMLSKSIRLIFPFLLMLVGTGHALTISAESNRPTFYGYGNAPLGIGLTLTKNFGKYRDTGYGIIVHVEYLDDQVGDNGRRVQKSAYFGLVGATLEREDDDLILVTGEGRRKVAEKGFFGWRKAPGVAIRHEIEENLGSFTVHVWLEVD